MTPSTQSSIGGSMNKPTEPFAWESKTVCFTRWITDTRYRKLRPSFQRWYRPICPTCGPRALTTDTTGGLRENSD
jgi:hypothetical protein